MYKKRIREFQLLFAALMLGIALLVTPSTEPAFGQGTLITDTITSPSLEGNLLGDPATRKMMIYLPPGYDTSDKRYPVVYLIHGSGGNHRSWAHLEYPEFVLAAFAPNTDFPEAGFASMVDELIAAGKMEEMILVMPDVSTKYGGSYCINSALNGNYEDYIIKDIVPYVDAHYRTLPSMDSRGIDGISMGGYASIYLAMRNPDVFGAVSSHSGPLILEASTRAVQPFIVAENPEGITGPDPSKPVTSFVYMAASAMLPNLDNPPFFVDLPFDDNGEIIEEVMQRLAPYDPVQMIPDHISDMASLRGIHLDGGDKDELGMGLIEQAFSEALTAAGIEHEFELFDGGHLDKLYTRLAIALSFFSDVLVGEELFDYTNVFFTSLSPGLNMISLPLKPQTPYTARSFAEELSATTVITLDEARQRFIGFTLDAPDDGFAIEGGKGYIVNVPEAKVVAFTGAAWTNQPPLEAAPILTPIGGAWAFVVSGRLLDDSNDSLKKDGYLVTVRNTRTNDVATDIVRSRYFAAAFADLTRNNVVQTGDRLELQVRNTAGEIVSDIIPYTVTAETIRQALLPITLKNVEIPRQNLLLQNYPNPFNPETFLPYQIRESAEVVIRIYDSAGRLVRTLDLGQRQSGFYLGHTRAAYWNGHNDAGEKVSSGIYFYQLQAGDFNATRKLVIMK